MPEIYGIGARPTIGWDLGGIHLKAALVEGERVREAVQVPCLLWRGLDALDDAFAALPDWARGEALHAVTMTGELCDYFVGREEGVAELAGWAGRTLRGNLRIYGGRSGFLSPDTAVAAAADIASANWHATARLAGRYRPDAFLVDIGSTTSDLVPVTGGMPASLGYSDVERLETGELVYTGAVRTPLMALATHVPFRGHFVSTMAEHFATTADIHRLLGALSPKADQQDSADGRGKSLPETETRLARVVGCDRSDATPAEWRRLATYFAQAQLRRLHDAAAQILSRAELPDEAPVIGCGVGRFMAAQLAYRLQRDYIDLADLLAPAADPAWVSSCAPAVAVALIAAGE
jgi:probable H4MPT-linked C1 transfer pathway protein